MRKAEKLKEKASAETGTRRVTYLKSFKVKIKSKNTEQRAQETKTPEERMGSIHDTSKHTSTAVLVSLRL